MAEIGVVIVTFNRLEKLRKTLNAYATQTVKAKYIIVVNNASSDGTSKFLDEWRNDYDGVEKIVLNLPENIGGSGGFYEGEKVAIIKNADWIMLGDDDAYPTPNYIEGMTTYIEQYGEKCSIVCGRVLENNTYKHRCNFCDKYGQFLAPINVTEYEKKEVTIDVAGYLGIVINKEKLIKADLIRRDYFIWFDDVEHCIRLKKEGNIVCLTDYEIIHDTENQPNTLSWKEYYGWRNRTDIMKKHYSEQFIFWVIVMLIKALLCTIKGTSLTEAKMRIRGIIDGILGHMGIHDTYKPGWKA